MRIIVCLVLFLSGCSAHKEPVPAKIINVSRVFFMGNGSYAVLIEDPETKEIKRQYLDCNRYKIKVFADCPNDSKMWVDGVMEEKATYVIHVRSSDDIAGGNTGGKSPSPINVVK